MEFETRLPDDSVNVPEGSAAVDAIWLVVGVAGTGIALTLLLALSIEALVPLVPVSLEAKLSTYVADALDGDETEGATPDLTTADVQALVDRLAIRWTDSPYPGFHVQVIEDPSPNAFAIPGGVIVVTEGLLDRIESENELAFVLGHELGHFAGRDHLRGIGRGLAVSIVAGLFGVDTDPTGSLAGIASTISSRHFDRRQESDADLFGLDLLAAEYGHAGGAHAVFERVLIDPSEGAEADSDAPGAIDRLGGYLSTHPLGPDRIERLDEGIARGGWPASGPLSPWTRSLPPEAEDEPDGVLEEFEEVD